MMNKKLTTTLLGLLLAVGWTSSASAQALPQAIMTKAPARVTTPSPMMETANHSGDTWQPYKFNWGSQFTVPQDSKSKGSPRSQAPQSTRFMAPKRSQNYNLTATVTHPKSWYQNLPEVTWSGGSQNITEPFTDVDGMMALVERVYTDKDIPGAKYSETWHCDIPYQTIEYGWDIKGTQYEDIQIKLYSGYIDIYGIRIKDKNGNVLYNWTAPQTNGASAGLPSSWTLSDFENGSASLTQEYVSSQGRYAYWMGSQQYGGGIINIPARYLNSLNNTTGYLSIEVCSYFNGASEYVSPTTSNTAVLIGNETFDFVRDSAYSNSFYYSYPTYIPGTITPPDECGYTVLLVKLHTGKNQSGTPPYEVPDYTHSKSELRDYFTEYVKEIDLLTDGMRVNEGDTTAGTVFAYTGDLGRFYFIGKGKMSYTSSLEAVELDMAPFYSMYEEFSPNAAGSGNQNITDFYEKMKQGVTYPVVHDCQSVNYLQHYFSMAGKQGTNENRVNSLVLFIPDYRGNGNRWSRTYDTFHQPTVGMYMVDLYAEVEPSTTPDYYTVTVHWYDNLDDLTHTENIPQTYTLYETKINPETGQVETHVVYTGMDTSWNFDYPVGDPSYYDISYYVVATPVGEGGTTENPTYTNPDFFAKSNTDDVTIPGKSDFLGLQWQRYESDYVILNPQEQVNYYRNWLAPHALSVQGEAGITAGNVGTTGRTLTLYRGETPIMYLDLMMDGNKAYYRIRHINKEANQQVEDGYDPETGELKSNTNN